MKETLVHVYHVYHYNFTSFIRTNYGYLLFSFISVYAAKPYKIYKLARGFQMLKSFSDRSLGVASFGIRTSDPLLEVFHTSRLSLSRRTTYKHYILHFHRSLDKHKAKKNCMSTVKIYDAVCPP